MAVLSMDSAYHASSSSYPLKYNKDQSCYCVSIKSMKKHISVVYFISENVVGDHQNNHKHFLGINQCFKQK